ncbi:MAG: glycosyltransferase family 87 protein [Chloroflexota bacterium]
MSLNNTIIPPAFSFALLCLFIVASISFYFSYTSQRNAVADFYIEWKGTQVALEGGNPYSNETTRLIQLGSKGRLVEPGEDQLAFVYPYWRIFFNAPIAFLSYDWASAAWLGFLLTLYCGALYLLQRGLNWKSKSPIKNAFYYLAFIFSFPAFSSLMLGQSALLVTAFIGGVYYFLKKGATGTAGVLLALATVKPQLTLALIPLLLIRALWRREWRFIIAFFVTMGLLAAISFILFPAWLSEFIAVATRYPSYKPSLTGTAFAFVWLDGAVGTILGWFCWLLLACAGVWLWWRFTLIESGKIKAGLAYDLSFSIALILTLLLPPQTNISNPVLLFVPIALLMSRASERGFWSLALGIIVISWLIYFLFYSVAYGAVIIIPPILIAIFLFFNFRKVLSELNTNAN